MARDFITLKDHAASVWSAGPAMQTTSADATCVLVFGFGRPIRLEVFQ